MKHQKRGNILKSYGQSLLTEAARKVYKTDMEDLKAKFCFLIKTPSKQPGVIYYN